MTVAEEQREMNYKYNHTGTLRSLPIQRRPGTWKRKFEIGLSHIHIEIITTFLTSNILIYFYFIADV